MDTTHAIRAEGLRKRYGDRSALDGLHLAVRSGTVHGLLGPNGAGKTTAVRVLATLRRFDGGRAEVAGVDVARHPGRVRTLIGLTGQYAALDEVLTGRQNLEMFGRLFHLGGRGARRAPPSCWSGSAWPRPRTGASRSTAAACGAVWIWPRR